MEKSFYDIVKSLSWQEVTDSIYSKTENDVVRALSKKYLDIEGAYTTRMKIKCDMDELKEYYQGFTNMEFEDESIILELEKPVKLTIEDDELVISYK